MKIRHTTSSGQDKVEMQMTPMIDIVFQLLAFFIFSFKIATQEGDFNIKMPSAAPAAGPSEQTTQSVMVKLVAGDKGGLAGVYFGAYDPANPNENRLEGGFRQLNARIRGMFPEGGPIEGADPIEVEIDSDYDLRYEHVMRAITAVSGYVTEDGTTVRLVEKINFTKPRPPQGE